MHPMIRVFGIATIFSAASVSWMILGGVTSSRNSSQRSELTNQVGDLWGQPHQQMAPEITFANERQDPASTNIAVDLALDQRRKGLMWYSLYDVRFNGAWTYVHNKPISGNVHISFAFPDPSGVYDDFHFYVNGKDHGTLLRPNEGRVELDVPVNAEEEIAFSISYKSRGMDEWRYVAATGVANLKNFTLDMTTNFPNIDFPRGTMSPSERAAKDGGWTLAWKFSQVVTGHPIGMAMPAKIQPGELASALAFSAPVSLFFFFLVIYLLATIRKLEIHPVNYLFIAGAFFAFHLLFSYSVDHLDVVVAFAMSSIVSVFLVVSYLRLVVSSRFAFVEAAAAQMIYLVGFSVAHFWDGFTGITITVLSIVTLFLLMQLTGRIKWNEALSVAVKPERAPA